MSFHMILVLVLVCSSHTHMISLMMTSHSSLCLCLQFAKLTISSLHNILCRDHSTTVNYQGSHLVKVRTVVAHHLVLEAVTDPLLPEIAVLVCMTVGLIMSSSPHHGHTVMTMENLSVAIMEVVGRQVQAVAVPARVDQDRVVANRVVANQAATNRTKVTVDGDAGHFDDAVLRMICFTCDVL